MLIGEYTHTLDAKKRLSLPAKFRKELGKKVVITHGLDSSLFVYPLKTWESVCARLSELSMGQSDTRGFSRFILAGAVEVEVDSIGRILIPDFLKEFANLRSRVVLTGVFNRVEIWNDKVWAEYKKRMEKQADVLAEKLGEIGVI
jgi:MraZ protein